MGQQSWFLLEALGRISFLGLFHILKVAHSPWLVAPSLHPSKLPSHLLCFFCFLLPSFKGPCVYTGFPQTIPVSRSSAYSHLQSLYFQVSRYIHEFLELAYRHVVITYRQNNAPTTCLYGGREGSNSKGRKGTLGDNISLLHHVFANLVAGDIF